MNKKEFNKRLTKLTTWTAFILVASTSWITKVLAELFGKIFDFLEPYKCDLKHSVTGKTYQPEEVCEVTPEEPTSAEEPLNDDKPQG